MTVAEGFGPLATKITALQRDLDGRGLRSITNDVAYRGKKDVMTEVVKDLGPDMRMRNWGRFRFGAGYELTSNTSATLTPRPAGPWRVLNFGRYGKPRAYPRGRRRKKIYRTPMGPRTATQASGWASGRTQGKRTFENAAKVIARRTPERVHEATSKAISKHFGRF